MFAHVVIPSFIATSPALHNLWFSGGGKNYFKEEPYKNFDLIFLIIYVILTKNMKVTTILFIRTKIKKSKKSVFFSSWNTSSRERTLKRNSATIRKTPLFTLWYFYLDLIGLKNSLFFQRLLRFIISLIDMSIIILFSTFIQKN